MPRIVYRYPLAITDEVQTIQTPPNPIIRHIGDRPGAALDKVHGLNAWVEHDIDLDGANPPTDSISVRLLPTGAPLPDDAFYLGSVTTAPFIWHAYEVVS